MSGIDAYPRKGGIEVYAYCTNWGCRYDSGDKNTLEEIKRKVKSDGGTLATRGDENKESKCPRCGQINSLRVD